jgi:hypothetical protein
MRTEIETETAATAVGGMDQAPKDKASIVRSFVMAHASRAGIGL